jgi:hypothetical protein
MERSFEESLHSITSETAVSSCIFNSIQYFNNRGTGFTVKNRVSKNKSAKYTREVNEKIEEKDLKNKYKLLSRKFHGSIINRNDRIDLKMAPNVNKMSLDKSEKKKVRLFGF